MSHSHLGRNGDSRASSESGPETTPTTPTNLTPNWSRYDIQLMNFLGMLHLGCRIILLRYL